MNIGKTNYLISSSTIKAGEEVADIYSMHFSEINRKGRRDWLNKNFHFICNCLVSRLEDNIVLNTTVSGLPGGLVHI